MNLIQPPTDNLYKFLAISGLLLIGFAVVFPFTKLMDLKRMTVELSGEVSKLKVESQLISKELDRQEKESKALLDLFEEKTEQKSFWKQDKQYVTFVVEEIRRQREKASEVGDKNDLVLIKLEEIKTKDALLNELRRQMKILMIAANIVMFLGFCAAILGFKLWFEKIQRPQDIMTAKELSQDTSRQEAAHLQAKTEDGRNQKS
jgi:hypothetical protein